MGGSLALVSRPGDKLHMYFHFPTSDMTSTLHLHICMNRPMGALERYRAYDLDDIIQHLSQVSRVRARAAT